MDRAGENRVPSSPLDDEALVSLAAAGDREAREALARSSLTRVRRIVHLTTRGGNEADDIVQMALSRAFSRLHTFRGESKFTTWLDRVTINTVREHYRSRPLVHLFFNAEKPAETNAPKSESPERRAQAERLLLSLRQHLDAIRPKKRIALVLFAVYGYTMSEIGSMVGCSVETAKKRVQHGRRELLERLRRDPTTACRIEELDR
ncbi:MAG: sigma-70 family RNA polymerase sigma factor [Polyangia bacterium]